VVTVGGAFEEREGVKAELLETLHAGPGEAARQEVMAGTSGPVLSRWTLRKLRVSVAWLTGYSLSGVWQVLHACGLGWHTARARLFSPDPDYRSKVRRLHRCLREAARQPERVVALFLDELAIGAGLKSRPPGAWSRRWRNAPATISNDAPLARSMP
jgi:hypothetical protein